MELNGWYYSPDHGQVCQVIEAQTVWGETTCRVWLPNQDIVVGGTPTYVLPAANHRTGQSLYADSDLHNQGVLQHLAISRQQ